MHPIFPFAFVVDIKPWAWMWLSLESYWLECAWKTWWSGQSTANDIESASNLIRVAEWKARKNYLIGMIFVYNSFLTIVDSVQETNLFLWLWKQAENVPLNYCVHYDDWTWIAVWIQFSMLKHRTEYILQGIRFIVLCSLFSMPQ